MKRRNPGKQPPFKLSPQRVAYIRYKQYLLSMKRMIDETARRLIASPFHKSATLGRSIRISAEANRAARRGFEDTKAPVIPYLPYTCNESMSVLTQHQRLILENILGS